VRSEELSRLSFACSFLKSFESETDVGVGRLISPPWLELELSALVTRRLSRVTREANLDQPELPACSDEAEGLVPERSACSSEFRLRRVGTAAQKLVELEMDCPRIAVLAVLDQEHEQKGDY
jgi:hypothetical protein